MAQYTTEVATDFNFPNITVYRKYRDGEHYAWRFVSNDGYVMYDTTATETELAKDPVTGEFIYDPDTGLPVRVPTIYYFTNVDCPLNYNWANVSWVAVPVDTVPTDHILGGEDNDHEVM